MGAINWDMGLERRGFDMSKVLASDRDPIARPRSTLCRFGAGLVVGLVARPSVLVKFVAVDFGFFPSSIDSKINVVSVGGGTQFCLFESIRGFDTFVPATEEQGFVIVSLFLHPAVRFSFLAHLFEFWGGPNSQKCKGSLHQTRFMNFDSGYLVKRASHGQTEFHVRWIA